MSHRVSAIDIGSNAIRMMVAEVGRSQMKVLKKFRAPVRLGKDAFMNGEISTKSLKEAIQAFSHFSEANQKHQVVHCRAVATSALRESQNKNFFIQEIKKQSGIQIEVIDGIEEARLIHLAVRKELHLDDKKTMLIDVGGGSVEVTFGDSEKILASKSFPMGTVRILDLLKKRNWNEKHLNLVMAEFMEPLSQHIHTQTDHEALDFAIGTGGNLECMGRLKVQLLKKTPNTFVTLKELGDIIQKLKGMSVRERIEKLDLKPDRADVILPASMLIQTIMRQGEVEKIMIPCVGLRDGILWSMIESSI